MAFSVRRVITGHDASGRAVVKIDEVAKHTFVGRPGATASHASLGTSLAGLERAAPSRVLSWRCRWPAQRACS